MFVGWRVSVERTKLSLESLQSILSARDGHLAAFVLDLVRAGPHRGGGQGGAGALLRASAGQRKNRMVPDGSRPLVESHSRWNKAKSVLPDSQI